MIDGVYTVVGTTTTDASGFYQFTGLSAGTYEIIEVDQPTSFGERLLEDGDDYVGSLGGDLGLVPGSEPEREDAFTNINLLDGQQGVEYNFTEILFQE
jgi:hypothetical protein